jgi:hypothetical protein
MENSRATVDELIDKVNTWNYKHRENSKVRGIIGKVRNVLEVATKFTGIIGTFIQHNPEISSLVLGGFRVLLMVTFLSHLSYLS